MSRRARTWLAALGALDLLVLGLTIHANVTYHPSGTGSPSVMSLGQLLGWVVFGILTLVLLFVAKESRR